jgi:glycosyltransferase involved in cell wall biosynthesis
MRIGIEFLYARQGTTQGYDSSLRNLLAGLEAISPVHEIVVFCNTSYYRDNKGKFFNLQLLDCQGRWQNRLQRAVWMSTRLPGLIRQYGLNGIYFPTHFRSVQDLKQVWTVFNVYDLQYRYIPTSFGRFQRLVRDLFYRLSFARCDRGICISNYAMETVREQFPSLPPERLTVIPIPVTFDNELEFSTEDSLIDLPVRPYLLTIGKHFPHKNFETLLRAFAILVRTTQYPGSLILAGDFTSQTPFLRALADELGIVDRVRFMGYVSDVVREHLYRSADVFVFPSLYEGFGMPVVEAMGRQIPVVCGDTTSLPEVTLGLATYYSPATDAQALAQAIIKVLRQPPTLERLQEISSQVRQVYNAVAVARQYLALWESLGK